MDGDVRSGTLNWMVPDCKNSTGRLMVTNRSKAMAKSYSCGNFTVICGLIVDTNNSDCIPICNMFAGYSGVPQFCNAYSPSQCYGNNTGGGSGNVTNNVSPSSIVQLNSEDDVSSTSPNLLGVSDGER